MKRQNSNLIQNYTDIRFDCSHNGMIPCEKHAKEMEKTFLKSFRLRTGIFYFYIYIHKDNKLGIFP